MPAEACAVHAVPTNNPYSKTPVNLHLTMPTLLQGSDMQQRLGLRPQQPPSAVQLDMAPVMTRPPAASNRGLLHFIKQSNAHVVSLRYNIICRTAKSCTHGSSHLHPSSSCNCFVLCSSQLIHTNHTQALIPKHACLLAKPQHA